MHVTHGKKGMRFSSKKRLVACLRAVLLRCPVVHLREVDIVLSDMKDYFQVRRLLDGALRGRAALPAAPPST